MIKSSPARIGRLVCAAVVYVPVLITPSEDYVPCLVGTVVFTWLAQVAPSATGPSSVLVPPDVQFFNERQGAHVRLDYRSRGVEVDATCDPVSVVNRSVVPVVVDVRYVVYLRVHR